MNRKQLVVAVQALVSIGLMLFLFRGLDLDAFRTIVHRIPVWFYFASLGVVLAGQVMYAWRWRLLLVCNGVHVSVGTVIRQYFIGILLNNFFPSTVGGDVAKVYYLGREHGYRPVAASVVLDRVLGMGLLALTASVLLWTQPAASPQLAAARLLVTGFGAVAVIIVAVAIRGTGGLPSRVARFGPRAVGLAERLQRFRQDMAAAAERPAVLWKAFAVVVTYFAAVTVIYQVFVRLTVAVSPPFVPVLTAVMATAVLSNIPISLNGLGLREQLHVLLLQPLGVPPEVAVAISLLLYAHLLVASLIGIVFWMRAPVLTAEAIDRFSASV
jgi:uncharacterized protein (TIRG00374 family)